MIRLIFFFFLIFPDLLTVKFVWFASLILEESSAQCGELVDIYGFIPGERVLFLQPHIRNASVTKKIVGGGKS